MKLYFFAVLVLMLLPLHAQKTEINLKKKVELTLKKGRKEAYLLTLYPDRTATYELKNSKLNKVTPVYDLQYTWKPVRKGILLSGRTNGKEIISVKINYENGKFRFNGNAVQGITRDYIAANLVPSTGQLENGFKVYAREENGTLKMDANYIYTYLNGTKPKYRDNPKYFYEFNKSVPKFSVVEYQEVSPGEFHICCGVYFKKSGKVLFSPVLKLAEEGMEISIEAAGQKRSLKTVATGAEYKKQPAVVLNIPKAGFYTIDLQGTNKGEKFSVKAFELTGEAVDGAQAVAIRYRPSAHHGGFKTNLKNPQIAIVSIEKLTLGESKNYIPVTSPFGYLNPIFFSIWCGGLDKGKTAELDRVNYLLGVPAKANFGSFNHEGCGVKVKTPGKGEGPTLNDFVKYTMALKAEPFGEGMTKYTSYYFNPNMKRWIYKGACVQRKKYTPVRKVGSFVEPLDHERKGPVRREVRYKAWFIDQDNSVHVADEVSGTLTDPSRNTYNRTFMKNGYVHFVTGGWDIVTAAAQPKQKLKFNEAETGIPDCLKGENLQFLLSDPIIYDNENKDTVKTTASSALIPVHLIKGYGPDAKLFIAYGERDCLTFGKTMYATPEFKPILWSHEFEAGTISEKSKTVKLNGLKGSTRYYYRIRVESPEGKVWNSRSGSFTTR